MIDSITKKLDLEYEKSIKNCAYRIADSNVNIKLRKITFKQ